MSTPVETSYDNVMKTPTEENSQTVNYTTSPVIISPRYKNNDKNTKKIMKYTTLILDILYRLFAFFALIQSFSLMSIDDSTITMIGIYIMFFSMIFMMIGIKYLHNKFDFQISRYFMFLNSNIGRSLTIMFIAFLIRFTRYDKSWNEFVFIYNITISILHFINGFVLNYLHYTNPIYLNDISYNENTIIIYPSI